METVNTKTCKCCNNEFKSNSNLKTYCSSKCQLENSNITRRVAKLRKTCIACKTSYLANNINSSHCGNVSCKKEITNMGNEYCQHLEKWDDEYAYFTERGRNDAYNNI